MFIRKEPPPPRPAWVKWLVIGFLAYIFFASQQKDSPVHDNLQKAVDDIAENTPSFSEYKNKILPPTAPSPRASDIEPGEGMPVICGQEVTLAYEAFSEDGAALPDAASAEKPLVFKVGHHSVMPALEQGVFGMKKGGKRKVTAPAALSYGLKEYAKEGISDKDSAVFTLHLLDTKPALPDLLALPFRIANIKSGNGNTARCGDTVKADFTVWDIEGKKLYSTKDESQSAVSVTIGKSEMFLGLEQALIGMSPGGARSVIVPPAFQQPLFNDKPLVHIPFPARQTVLVDIETLP